MVEHYNTGTCTIRVGHDYVCLNFGSNSAASVSVQDRARELRAIGIDVEVVAADHALRAGAGRPWHGTDHGLDLSREPLHLLWFARRFILSWQLPQPMTTSTKTGPTRPYAKSFLRSSE